MSQLVPTRRTQPTMRDFAAALLAVWPTASRSSAGVLYAQFAGETASGYHCYGHNLGNVKWTRGCGYDYHVLRGVWEGFAPATAERLIATGQWVPDPSPDHARAVGAGRVSIIALPNNPASWFRSYDSLRVGMELFVGAKRNPEGRFASAWPFVVAGDCDGYARELGRQRYYTASPDAYSASMQTHHRKWMQAPAFEEALAALEVAPSPPPPAPTDPQQEEASVPPVDVVTGEAWVLPFAIVRPRLDTVLRCPRCSLVSCSGGCD